MSATKMIRWPIRWPGNHSRRFSVWSVLLTLVGVTLAGGVALQPGNARGHDPILHDAEVLDLVGFDQRHEEQIPLETTFRDESGEERMLRAFLGERPIVLALSYFECETLCPLVRSGLVESLRGLGFTVGREFDVVLVSINPDETPADAASAKSETLDQYGKPESDDGWHFLTGEHEAIDQLAEAIGFRYAYDAERDEYAHPSGIVLLTPGGKIARYFFGIEFAAQDLRLGLVDASENKIGSPIDQLLLLCYHYDPAVGKYNLLIMNIVRLAGLATVAALGALILVLHRQDTGQESGQETGRTQAHG